MRHHQHAAREIDDGLLQAPRGKMQAKQGDALDAWLALKAGATVKPLWDRSPQRGDVQIIGRLVKQKKVAGLPQRASQVQPVALAS